MPISILTVMQVWHVLGFAYSSDILLALFIINQFTLVLLIEKPFRLHKRRRDRRSAARANCVNAEKASNLAKTEVINGIDESAEKVSNKETAGTVATEIEKNNDKAKEYEGKELEETEEVLEENNNEQIAEKADNDVYAIEDENWKSAIEESCVKANNSVTVQTNMGSNSVAEGGHEHDDIVLESKEEGFIGPRLPKVMTDKEFKALMDKHFADKYS